MNEIHTVLLGENEIQMKVGELADRINLDYERKEFLLIVIANGALVFASDLLRRLTGKVRLDTLKATSYSGTVSGKLTVRGRMEDNFTGRHILLLDDILDSGQTLHVLRGELMKTAPASVRTCVLLDKPSGRRVDFQADYIGFTIPGEFVYGYGLDDENGLYRNLPFLATKHNGSL